MKAKPKPQILSREQVLAATVKRKTVDVPAPRLGGTVRLRELTTGEMFEYRRETKDMDNDQSSMHMLARCWVNDAGDRLFDGEEGIAALGSIPVEVLNGLAGPLLEVNGLGKDAVEAAEKNS